MQRRVTRELRATKMRSWELLIDAGTAHPDGHPSGLRLAADDDPLCGELVRGRNSSGAFVWCPHLLRSAPEQRGNWRLTGEGA